jgi:hypothetical protein
MIKIEIQAEDYRVAEAMSDLVMKIENGNLLDSVYLDRAERVTIREDNYTATLSKVKEIEKPKMSAHKSDLIDEIKLYAGLYYEINDLWDGNEYQTEKGVVMENGVDRFTNNDFMRIFETYEDIDEEVLENILEAVKEHPLVTTKRNVLLEDDETDFGGISFIGETLLDFMLSIPMPFTSSKEEIDKALKECGIKPIFEK